MKWAENNMKVNFQNVLFTDECRATLYGPDGWSRGWYDAQSPPPQRLRRQQGGGGVMFWAGIINNEMVGPFRVKDGVKITAETYTAFLKEFLLPWYKKKSLSFRKKMIFMHDNAPSHSACLTLDFLKKLLIKNATIMEWPPCSPDLNPIENLWSIIKRKIYANAKQFRSKDKLWNEIQVAGKDISADEVSKVTSSMDRRLIAVVANRGANIKY
jgi:transposase